MAIPKVIYQTYKTKNIPWYARFYIWRFRRNNRDFQYEFYDDERIDAFIKDNFSANTYKAFSRLQIGAAKADFFRYAILYKKGGIYLDIDSDILVDLNTFIRPDDEAIIAKEKTNKTLYAQWALFYTKEHPFLKTALHIMIHNIQHNKHPYNVHLTTGPGIYSEAVFRCLKNKDIRFRMVEDNYKGILKFKYLPARIFMSDLNPNHWRKEQQKMPVFVPEE